jgi:hypothetical protein
MTSVLAYKMLKVLEVPCREEVYELPLVLPVRGRVMGISPR